MGGLPFKASLGRNVSGTPSKQIKWNMVHVYIPNYTGGIGYGLRLALNKKCENLSEKITKPKRSRSWLKW